MWGWFTPHPYFLKYNGFFPQLKRLSTDCQSPVWIRLNTCWHRWISFWHCSSETISYFDFHLSFLLVFSSYKWVCSPFLYLFICSCSIFSILSKFTWFYFLCISAPTFRNGILQHYILIMFIGSHQISKDPSPVCLLIVCQTDWWLMDVRPILIACQCAR